MRMPVCWLGAGAGEEGAGGVVSGEEVGEGNIGAALGRLQQGAGVWTELMGD